MSRRDKYTHFKFMQAIIPQVADNADVTGSDVDTLGYDSVTFTVNLGELSSITSASYWVVRMQHADVSSVASTAGTYADVTGSAVLASGVSLATTLTSGIVYMHRHGRLTL
jgi:hypothetical protein